MVAGLSEFSQLVGSSETVRHIRPQIDVLRGPFSHKFKVEVLICDVTYVV